jgi:hypothetical protein
MLRAASEGGAQQASATLRPAGVGERERRASAPARGAAAAAGRASGLQLSLANHVT